MKDDRNKSQNGRKPRVNSQGANSTRGPGISNSDQSDSDMRSVKSYSENQSQAAVKGDMMNSREEARSASQDSFDDDLDESTDLSIEGDV